jgi:hypothetical protein
MAMADQIERRVETLTRVWWAWFVVYMFLGSMAMMEGGTSFLAATVDHVDSLWVKLIFLNIPLQMVLALSAVICIRSPRSGRRRIGLGVAAVNTTLILVHLALALYVRFAQ